MFYKGLNPMLVRMTACYRRRDRDLLAVGRIDIERSLAAAHRHEFDLATIIEVATAQRLPFDQDHPNASDANHVRPARTVGPKVAEQGECGPHDQVPDGPPIVAGTASVISPT